LKIQKKTVSCKPAQQDYESGGLRVGAQISKIRIRVKRGIVITTTAPTPASGATHPPIQCTGVLISP